MTLKLVYTTLPNQASALELAEDVVKTGHAACVNILPQMVSVYQWQGNLNRDDEVVVLVKTTHAKVPALMHEIERLHPYDTPAVLVLNVDDAAPAFAAWVQGQVKG